MTDYLEEALEGETEDREKFRPRRAAVRASRRESREPETEESGKNERELASGILTRRRALVRGEIGNGLRKPEQEKEREPARDREEETREETEKAAGREDGDVLPELTPKTGADWLQAERAARGGEVRDTASQTVAEDFPADIISAKNENAVGEALAEAERMAFYAGMADASSESVRSDVTPAWGTGGREEAAGILLRALGRAGRVSRTVRGGIGTAVVTLPGETAPVPEPDVEALDLAVRRDARRYDGGFQLF